jgi:hypothetical protein
MNDKMYVVIVDTRGTPPSQIDGYEEQTCIPKFFEKHVLDNPKVRCIKSKVAELCGLDMKLYFHAHLESHVRFLEEPPDVAITHEQGNCYPLNCTNRGATLFTFDPRTDFPEYKIMGKVYMVVGCGDYPLLSHQVWGIQKLIGKARDFYHCDRDHLHRAARIYNPGATIIKKRSGTCLQDHPILSGQHLPLATIFSSGYVERHRLCLGHRHTWVFADWGRRDGLVGAP